MLWVFGAAGVIFCLLMLVDLLSRRNTRRQLAGFSRARRIAAGGRLDEAAALLRESLRRRTHAKNLRSALVLIDDLCAAVSIELPPAALAIRARLSTREWPTDEELAQLIAFLDRSWPNLAIDDEPELERPVTYARNEALEQAIAAHPDDPAPYIVYADWLEEQGDPRGDLIALHHRIYADRAARIPLRREEQRLFERHAAHLLPFTEKDRGASTITVEWFCGFVHDAVFLAATPAQLERFLAHPSALFLRDLEIRDVVPETPDHDLDAAIRILERSPLMCLDRLHIEPLDLQLSWTRMVEIASLCPRFPSLRALRVGAGEMSFGRLDFPALTSLIVATGSLRREHLESIAAASLPALEHLELWFGDHNYGADCGVADVQRLCEKDRFPRVTSLGLKNAEFTDELCAVLHQLPILPQLRTLDLSMGTLSDEGARSLAEHSASYAHLERIDLGNNFIGPQGAALVHDLCSNVMLELQRVMEDELRFPSVGE